MPNWTKEQNEAILKDNTNIIVSAGAGSGKTAVLSERVLRKLQDGVNIDELLILTFTNAAASEMKDRIRKKIKEVKELEQQLDRIDSAYITTFDSYALSIVKKYNYLLNIGKNISIIDPGVINQKKEEYLNEIFEKLYSEKNPLFLKLIDDFCTKDDDEIKKAILKINEKLDMIYDKGSYLESYINNYYNDTLIKKRIEEYMDFLRDKIGEINKLFVDLEEYVDNDYYIKFEEAISSILYVKDYDEIKSLNIKLPILRDGSFEAKKIKDNISKIIKEIKDLTPYLNSAILKNSIYMTKEYVSIIIDIIKLLDQKLNTFKNKYDLYEFSDIAKMAIKVVESNSCVRDELKNSLNEIMIDEYQDTSDLQELFISYIQNNNVYMVGDIKQSIYRFRNANPNLFKNKYNLYSKNNGGYKIDLNKNFRSRNEVLNNINLIFNQIMDIKIGGADYLESHQMIYGNKAYDEMGNVNQNNNLDIFTYEIDGTFKKEEIEAFICAYDIKNKIENDYKIFDKDTKKIRKLEYSDIAILMSTSTNFNLYKKIFEYLNIPLCIYKDENISDNIDVFIIKNIINLMILNKDDIKYRYSFISVLRSYLYNMSDNEIFNYFENENYDDSDLIKLIKTIDYKNYAINEVIDVIIDKFKFYEKIITVGDIKKHIACLDYLIDTSNKLSEMGYTIYEFNDYLDKITQENSKITFSRDMEDNGVKIMTIHKSKGLEYHLCYYTGLYSKFNKQEINDKITFDNEYGIITPYIDNGIMQTFYKYLLKDKYTRDDISEKIRLFYVALTRAKEKMIMIMPNLKNEDKEFDYYDKMKYKSFFDIVDSLSKSLNPYIKKINLNDIPLTKMYNQLRNTNYLTKIKQSDKKIIIENKNFLFDEIVEDHFSKENISLYTEKNYDSIHFGRRMHTIFENIDFLNPDYTELSDYETKLVETFLSTNIFKDAINIFKEYEFIYDLNDINYHGIIDLLIETNDSFKIVDYKLRNTDDKAYLKQLKGYRDYIYGKTNKKVYIYLYSIMDGKLIQINS